MIAECREYSISLPALQAATEVTVIIPARDEAANLPNALAGLSDQRDVTDGALPADFFDVVVLANGCSDDTADLARSFSILHPSIRIEVVECTFAREHAHVGTARRTLMDRAASRFLEADRPRGIVASTDADTRVDKHWVHATQIEMQNADAVTGRIYLTHEELAALDPSTRMLYLRDQIHRRLVSELDAMYDPVGHDPLPRHGQHFGASFAVTAQAYRLVGGMPARTYHEDIAFYEALDRYDARVRHSMNVRVQTSSRTAARAHGGLASFLSSLAAGGTLNVEHPELTQLRLQTRANLRRLWRGAGMSADLACVKTAYDCTDVEWQTLFDRSDTFGNNLWRIEAFAAMRWSRWKPMPIADALPIIRVVHAHERRKQQP